MEYIKINDKMQISRVVFGCMRILKSGLTGDSLQKLVQQCLGVGIDTFDHAPVYGDRQCEIFFGEKVIAKLPGIRNKMKIISKAGICLPQGKEGVLYYDSSGEIIIQQVESSLKNLRTDHIDMLLIHRPDALADPEDTARALGVLVRSGKVLCVGVSNYAPCQVAALQKYLDIPITTNQIELSVIAPGHFFDGTLEDAWQRRMPLMAWSPLGGGKLFDREDCKYRELRGVLQLIAKDRECTTDVIAYAWLLSHPAPIAVVAGSRDFKRIERATEALNIRLSHEEWYRILAASRGFHVP